MVQRHHLTITGKGWWGSLGPRRWLATRWDLREEGGNCRAGTLIWASRLAQIQPPLNLEFPFGLLWSQLSLTLPAIFAITLWQKHDTGRLEVLRAPDLGEATPATPLALSSDDGVGWWHHPTRRGLACPCFVVFFFLFFSTFICNFFSKKQTF